MFHPNKISSTVKIITVVVLMLALVFAVAPTVALANSTPGTGQPSQSCQVTTVTPGHAASAPGSAFNSTGVAGSHYAGTQPQNSNNPKSVAQYDVACFQNTVH